MAPIRYYLTPETSVTVYYRDLFSFEITCRTKAT
jgi:hypothetical protein